MIKIKIENLRNPDLTSIIKRDRMYSVCIGNGLTCYFSDNRQALKYLVFVNNKLMSDLLEINHLYGSIFLEYRKNVILYNDYFLRNQYATKNMIELIEKLILRMFSKAGPENHNHFLFANFTAIIDTLIDFCELIKKPVPWLQKKNIELFTHHLEEIRKRIFAYGRELQSQTPKVFYDKSQSVSETR